MCSIKSEIIPLELKKNIDEILEKQLFNANRYYAESNPNISKLMCIETQKSSSEFLNELKNRWEWHNIYYENLLEPAFKEIVNKNFDELSPREVEDLINIYETCCIVDEATLVTSGAIKKHLEYKLAQFKKQLYTYPKKDIDQIIYKLLTPPVESFFVQYMIDHLSYIILLKTDEVKASKWCKYLLKQYHANDEIIFKNRFNKKFSEKMKCTVDTLLLDISEYKINHEYKIDHFYFTLEHPERKAFRDIMIFDNLDEKLIASQLIGISGFLFRKSILNYLNDSNILKNNGYIYEFSNSVIINSLYGLRKDRDRNMEKNVRPYKQRGMTCAIACMLMVLEYYQVIPKANSKYEQYYFKNYHSKFLDGTPFSALAWHFAKNNLNTEIIHSEKNIFKYDHSFLSREMFDNAMKEYNRFLIGAKNKGAQIKNGVDIDCDLLINKLKDGNLIILAGQNGEYLHAILLCGYNNNDFIVCDPLFNEKQRKTYKEIENFMNTPLGKWIVVVSSKQKNKDLLMENLDVYKQTGLEKLELDKDRSKEYIKKNVI